MERTHARNAAEQESALGDLAISQAANDATIDDLRGQLREAEAQQADMAAEVTDLREQLREAEERAKESEAQQADMAAEVTDLREQLRELEEEVSKVRGMSEGVSEESVGVEPCVCERRSIVVETRLSEFVEGFAFADEGAVAGADGAVLLSTVEMFRREELWRRMWEEALELAEESTELLRMYYEDRLCSVEQELECTSLECTDTLEKLEEFVNLLDGARGAERAAVHARDECERELHALQERYDREVAENQRLLLREGRGADDAPGGPTWTEGAVDFGAQRDSGGDDSIIEPGRRGDGGGRSAPVLRTIQEAASVGLGEQLEQLKREKEVLMEELEAKGVSYNDALALLNQHISQLMEELSVHLRGGETSASNARALLLEIAELRAAQERTGAFSEGGAPDSSS
ncbi:hypothetical_protein (plasmid) [Leishmania braziliensis MHOM/BR/75/M2904]|uniref:Hypothetical_protein n=1 Tax=Leishmania braziliensis MHOM/BR/75/M2904 TaxID=420245 RepID=A0A3P3Z710_LEIBR|nr:hypothetical_protein [Leishmania braziliensis MHOM/BR/75/M2904]